jgi:hypothetical protein
MRGRLVADPSYTGGRLHERLHALARLRCKIKV